MLEQVRPKINHFFARLDAGEIVRGAQPIKRVVAPTIAAGLAGAQIAYDLKHAPDKATKKKVLIRDFLVIGGILAGLIASGKILNRIYGATGHLHLPGIAHHHHGHGKEAVQKTVKKAVDRVISLFKSPKCNHGGEGAVRLQTMAFGGIFGGALGGVLGDWFNKEDVKKTSAIKLKEGLFQYIGNITFCTISILAVGKLGRFLAEKYTGTVLKSTSNAFKSLKDWLVNGSQKLVANLQKKEVGNLRTVPGAASEAFETYWLMAQRDMPVLKKELKHLLHHADDNPKALNTLMKGLGKIKAGPAAGDEATGLFVEGMQRYLGEEFADILAGRGGTALMKEINTGLLPKLATSFRKNQKKEAVEAFRQFYSNRIMADLKTVSKQSDSVIDVARERFAIAGERVGIIAGLFAGVIGGAFASNKINSFLTDTLNLPEGHKVNGLFSSHHHNKGWMEGTVGDRGIHWWDAILHLDDWPTALYIAGVHSVEAFINVLYGISGFLTGTAGTDYQGISSQQTFHTDHNHGPYHPLVRHHGVYSRFMANR